MSALPRGTLLADGRYRIRKELNRGGTAIVYASDDLKTGTKVALKVMNTRDGVMTMPIRQVKREVEIASSMKHPNIVQLIDVFAEGTQLVIVWELVTGPDLLDLLNACNGRMTEKQAAHYFRQIHLGVTFLHDNGLCHRDLKPENCMVDAKTDTLKIIDFGLSKHLESAVTLGVGTPDYMAPEMLGYGGRGQGKVQPHAMGSSKLYDARAVDVWAMGVMLYLMVAGVYPFEDPNNPDNVACTLQNVRDGRIRPLPADVSHQCADLIVRMLHKKIAKRLTLEQTLLHPWIKMNVAALETSRSKGKAKSEMRELARKASDQKRKRTASSNSHPARRTSSAILEGLDAELMKTQSSRGSKSTRSKSSKSSTGFNKLMNSLKLF
ncbi:serine/threonine-protein kinase [Chloropicon primus]|nr:serine/threonine-protein kinase [Chloropicon primus]